MSVILARFVDSVTGNVLDIIHGRARLSCFWNRHDRSAARSNSSALEKVDQTTSYVLCAFDITLVGRWEGEGVREKEERRERESGPGTNETLRTSIQRL